MGEGEVGCGKPYMVSISGKTLADNLTMLRRVYDAVRSSSPGDDDGARGCRIAAVELNLACPNIVGKPTIGYDYDQMEDVLREVSSLLSRLAAGDDDGGGGRPPTAFPLLGVKLPPYFDRSHLVTAASVINRHKDVVGYVATINTVGCALAVDHVSEMKSLLANGGYAGLSGPAVKYTALANVRSMRELLDDSIDVVGVGGVRTGRDAFEMILCGASAVQVGTCHWIEGPGCFDRINDELGAIMAEKGYGKIEDFRGRLKEWNKEGMALSREARTAEKERGGGSSGGGTTSVGGPRGPGAADGRSILIAVLLAVVAILLADKIGLVSL
jgi:dihydroorotate dehydrogenase (fumarate)